MVIESLFKIEWFVYFLVYLIYCRVMSFATQGTGKTFTEEDGVFVS